MSSVSPLHAIASYTKSDNLRSLKDFLGEENNITTTSQPSFGDFVKGQVKDTLHTLHTHEATTVDAIRGKADPLAVRTSVDQAHQAVTMATTLVNKAVQVINEITKMSV